jgi:glycosyltransferase involved in cell wall biosynthesis
MTEPQLPEQYVPSPASGKRLQVVIAAVAATTSLSGVSRHAANLARCLLTRQDIADVHLFLGDWQLDALRAVLPASPRLHLHAIPLRRGTLSRNLWYYIQLPKLVADLDADILHLAYPVPLRRNAISCPTVVTLHDLYPYDIPQNFGFPKVFFNRGILQQCLGSAAAIACVSEATHRRLQMYAPELALQRASVVYNCVEAGPPESAVSPIPAWGGEPFLLCIAQHRHNKNIALAISTFRALRDACEIKPDTRLVVVGIPGPETRALRQQIHNSGLDGAVVLLTGIADAELEWCYAHCDLLMAPSRIEGFGLPIVEAMLHHCRIVCSDIPAFREVGGNYCVYADLDRNPGAAFLEAARAALKSHSFRAGNTARFSSERIAEQYVTLYHWLMRHHPVQSTLKPHPTQAQLKRERS